MRSGNQVGYPNSLKPRISSTDSFTVLAPSSIPGEYGCGYPQNYADNLPDIFSY